MNEGEGTAREDDRVDLEDIRDIVREDPVDLPVLADWNERDQV